MFKPSLTIQYIILIIIYIVAYEYSLVFAADKLNCGSNCSKTDKQLNNIHNSCIIKTSYNLSNTRGKNYILGDKTKSEEISRNCLMTFWSLSHFLLYSIIGFLAPSLFVEAITIGVLFEIYEYKVFDCHDVLDVAYNTSGFATGYLLNYMISNETKEE